MVEIIFQQTVDRSTEGRRTQDEARPAHPFIG